ncbi:hypothetical protein Tco_0817910, partial [Tanacetum coccineum]
EKEVVLTAFADANDNRVYTDIPAYVPLATPVQTPPSSEWSSSSLFISPSSPVVPSPIASPMATPTATISVDEDQFIERPVLALEARARQTDAQRAALWHAIYNIQRENQDLRTQLAEERRERLELADYVSRIERRQESREE